MNNKIPEMCLCCNRESITTYRGLCSYCQGTPLAPTYEKQWEEKQRSIRLERFKAIKRTLYDTN